MSLRRSSTLELIQNQAGVYSVPYVEDRLALEQLLDLNRVSYCKTKAPKYVDKFPAVVESDYLAHTKTYRKAKTSGGVVVMEHEATLRRYIDDFSMFGVKPSEVRRLYLSAGLAPHILFKYVSLCHEQQQVVFLDRMRQSNYLEEKIEGSILHQVSEIYSDLGSRILKMVRASRATQIANLNQYRFAMGIFGYHNILADKGDGAFRNSGVFNDAIVDLGIEKASHVLGINVSPKRGRVVWLPETIVAVSYLFPMDLPEISDLLTVATVGGTQKIS